MANPDDFTLISITGYNLFLNGVGLLATAIPYGIYLVLVCFTIVILCRNGGNSRAKIVLLLAVLSMFAISTFFVFAYACIFLEEIHMVFISGVTEPVANKIIAYRMRFTVLSLMQEVMFLIEVVIGDFVVVWRAWVLWSENRKIPLPSVLLLLCSAVSMLSFLGCFIHYDWPLIVPPTCTALNVSTYVLSMATNVAGTAAIGYKAWVHRCFLKKYHFAAGNHRVLKALVLLMESGMVYTLLWVLQLINFVPSVGDSYPGQLTQEVFTSISVQLVAIYPTMVIILVYLQRSMWDPSGSDLHADISVQIPTSA
ncbi:hypothetical protein V5O48_015199 [Marasmius crinis-equi]|uniref:Uncharacterized protein n=1 Tax=Marasmius crinis-equi TaxID=585013 RepID=A0ABR3EV66_9AGAR